MGFFSKLFENTNKYESHPDVLDSMASSVASAALELRKKNMEKTRSPKVYCEVGAWSIELSSAPFARYVGAALSEYCIRFDRFGMEDVPESDAALFLRALLPYLKKHLDASLRRYFPSASSVRAVSTVYTKEYYKDHDYDEQIPAIEIEICGLSYGGPAAKPLNKW